MNIKEIINSPEGRTLEFKSQASGKLDNILRTVIAFSNGSGGEIIIGVTDDRKPTGIDQDPFELEERLASSIHDRISPVPGVFFQTVSIDQHVLFRIKVLPGPNKPYYLKSKGPEKGTYIRVGSTNRFADEWVPADLRRQGQNRFLDEEVESRSSLLHSQTITCGLLDMPGMVIDAVGAYLGSKIEISSLRRGGGTGHTLACLARIHRQCNLSQGLRHARGAMQDRGVYRSR